MSDRNQRTGGGRGQIAESLRTVNAQVQADSARPSLLMDASPFGVSMCNALIFFFSFPGRGTALCLKESKTLGLLYVPTLPCSLPSVRLSRRSLSPLSPYLFPPPFQSTFGRKDLVLGRERNNGGRAQQPELARGREGHRERRTWYVHKLREGAGLIDVFFYCVCVCVAYADSRRHDTSVHRVRRPQHRQGGDHPRSALTCFYIDTCN